MSVTNGFIVAVAILLSSWLLPEVAKSEESPLTLQFQTKLESRNPSGSAKCLREGNQVLYAKEIKSIKIYSDMKKNKHNLASLDFKRNDVESNAQLVWVWGSLTSCEFIGFDKISTVSTNSSSSIEIYKLLYDSFNDLKSKGHLSCGDYSNSTRKIQYNYINIASLMQDEKNIVHIKGTGNRNATEDINMEEFDIVFREPDVCIIDHMCLAAGVSTECVRNNDGVEVSPKYFTPRLDIPADYMVYMKKLKLDGGVTETLYSQSTQPIIASICVDKNVLSPRVRGHLA